MTGCICSAVKRPPCSWCENSRECSRCGQLFQSEELEDKGEEKFCEECLVAIDEV